MTTGILAAVLTVAYSVFAHYASGADVGPWVIALAGAPMMLIGFGFARDSHKGAVLWLAALAALASLAWFWSDLDHPVRWLYFLQHVSINIMLGLIFGRTLLARRKPLCTVFAAVVHESMSPALLRYTRQITVAWTVFFIVSALLSVLLFFLAPIEAWSIFANILMLPLVGLMFIVENEVRKHILPREDRVGLRATVRAFRATLRS